MSPLDPRTWDFWVAFGLMGQMIFGARFIVQWVVSERKKSSHIPIIFWYLSLSGGIVTALYAIHRRDPVFIIGQSAGIVVYVRNLMLIYRNRAHAHSSSADDAPPNRP
ncbi:MAG TPA: lipid-A-disaccharide synthase N-terminal domain-containing protein [Thermoanaerobaculia bacterium]|nr:lipid-A-disaccharide synthase N-terminal domain-containing protein [Thermoanaerobaculia bacterium]